MLFRSLHLHPGEPLRSLTIRSPDIDCYSLIPRGCWDWLGCTRKLASLTIGKCMSTEIFMRFLNNCDPAASLRYLNITGVEFQWELSFCMAPEGNTIVDTTIRYDLIAQIYHFAPSLQYMHMNVGAAMMEILTPSRWIFDDALGPRSRSAALPRTVKRVFFHYEFEGEEKYCRARGNPMREHYTSFANDLREMMNHENRFKVVGFSDRDSSLK